MTRNRAGLQDRDPKILLTLIFLICTDQHELHSGNTSRREQMHISRAVFSTNMMSMDATAYYWCRFTGSIKTSNICCGSSGGAGISSGGAGFSSGDAGILLVRVRIR